jgi:hypothetical protein
VTPADSERKQLLEDIQNNGGMITLTELRQARSRWRAPNAAEMALRALDREGLGRLFMDDTNLQGGRPVMRFRLFEENDVIERYEIPDSPGLSIETPEG